jgi:hypothetical protein
MAYLRCDLAEELTFLASWNLSAYELEKLIFSADTELRWEGALGLARGWADDGRYLQVAIHRQGDEISVAYVWILATVPVGSAR